MAYSLVFLQLCKANDIDIVEVVKVFYDYLTKSSIENLKYFSVMVYERDKSLTNSKSKPVRLTIGIIIRRGFLEIDCTERNRCFMSDFNYLLN